MTPARLVIGRSATLACTVFLPALRGGTTVRARGVWHLDVVSYIIGG